MGRDDFFALVESGDIAEIEAAIQNGKPKCGIDVFAIDQEVGLFNVNGIHRAILYGP